MDKIAIILPCFNENRTVTKFLDELVFSIKNLPCEFLVILVDDCSTDETLELLSAYQLNQSNVTIKILTLQYNLGHQGAIYQGLLYAETTAATNIIVMDADGEDDPEAISQLLDLRYENNIVNVARRKRRESLFFVILYHIYKVLFKLITGKTMNYGNYCMIDRKTLSSVLDTSFIHLGARLSKMRLRSSTIPFDRRKRIDGHSKMSLNNLIFYAFQSLMEYAENLLMMFLKIFAVTSLTSVTIIIYVVYEKLFTDNAIIGWASTIISNFINASLICLGFFVMGLLLLNLGSRQKIPLRKVIHQEVK